MERLQFALDGEPDPWFELKEDELPAQAYGRLLLLPGTKAPVALQSRGKPVCSCFSVSDADISACLNEITSAAGGAGYLARDADRLLLLQDKLKCGTNCGSCVPEIKRIIRSATDTRLATPVSSDSSAASRTVIPIWVVA